MRRLLLVSCALVACGTAEPEYSTTVQEAVVVGPSTGSFGGVNVGTTSAPISFVISPSGSGDSNDTVLSITGCPMFNIVTPQLPAEVFRRCNELQEELNPNEQAMDIGQSAGPGEQALCPSPNIRTLPFTATFAPTAAGDQTCTAQVKLASGGASFTLAGTGKLPDFQINVSPRSIDFLDIDEEQESSARLVTIRNLGSQKLSLSAALKGQDPSMFKLVGTAGQHELASGEQETYAITCRPEEPVTYRATLDIASNDPVNPGISVQLSCRGIRSSLAIAPNAFDVTTLVGQPKVATVTITNDGNVNGIVKSVTLVDAAANIAMTTASFEGQDLDVGEGRTVSIEFTPNAPVADDVPLGKLLVEFDNDAPREIGIFGAALQARLATEPNLLDFGPVCANVAAIGRHVDAFAGDQGVFQVTAATVTEPFTIDPATLTGLPFSAAPPGNTRHRFDLSVTPASPGLEPAEVTGTLTIQSTSPGEESFDVGLRATALPQGITALPADLHLGATQVDELTPVQTVTFTNCSDAPVTVIGQTIAGDHPDDFVLTKPVQPLDVQPAETITIDVLFRPRASGARAATLTVDFTGGTTTVNLGGDGIGIPLSRESYYACNAGGAGGWLVGFLVVGLVIRRRRS